jgi:hypothetical protein
VRYKVHRLLSKTLWFTPSDYERQRHELDEFILERTLPASRRKIAIKLRILLINRRRLRTVKLRYISLLTALYQLRVVRLETVAPYRITSAKQPLSRGARDERVLYDLRLRSPVPRRFRTGVRREP